MNRTKKAVPLQSTSNPVSAKVHCPICTHTVEAQVQSVGRNSFVTPGQKCARCQGSLDAGFILVPAHAA